MGIGVGEWTRVLGLVLDDREEGRMSVRMDEIVVEGSFFLAERVMADELEGSRFGMDEVILFSYSVAF